MTEAQAVAINRYINCYLELIKTRERGQDLPAAKQAEEAALREALNVGVPPSELLAARNLAASLGDDR